MSLKCTVFVKFTNENNYLFFGVSLFGDTLNKTLYKFSQASVRLKAGYMLFDPKQRLIEPHIANTPIVRCNSYIFNKIREMMQNLLATCLELSYIWLSCARIILRIISEEKEFK